jgi:hypothetical protein
MILNETVYHNAGYKQTFKDDDITREVIEYVENEANVAFLECANQLGIPPCLAFIMISTSEKQDLFSKFLETDGDKQYFGTLFGAVFRTLGYVREKEKPLFLKNASTFRRIEK